MDHSHVLFDGDPSFKVNPTTRAITNESLTKLTLIQHDHNSERFTVECPRYVESHDLLSCNRVEFHYLNIEANTKRTNAGIYTVDDLQVKTDDENTVVCSWLVSNNATQFVGQLSFLIRFSCISDNGAIEYAWNTGIYSGLNVSNGIYNANAVAEDYADVLIAWERELKSNQVVKMEQTQISNADGGENVWTATFGDGRTESFTVKNGSRGETGYIGAVKTVDGSVMQFFVGTREKLEVLTDAQKVNLFAVITDDKSFTNVLERVSALEGEKLSLYQHSVQIKARTSYRGVSKHNLYIKVVFSDSVEAKHDVEYIKALALANGIQREQFRAYFYNGYYAGVVGEDETENPAGQTLVDSYEVHHLTNGDYNIKTKYFDITHSEDGYVKTQIIFDSDGRLLEMDSVEIVGYSVMPITKEITQ